MIGVERDVVVEAVEFDEDAARSSCRVGSARVRGVAAGAAVVVAAAMTRVRDDDGGGRWMPARCG